MHNNKLSTQTQLTFLSVKVTDDMLFTYNSREVMPKLEDHDFDEAILKQIETCEDKKVIVDKNLRHLKKLDLTKARRRMRRAIEEKDTELQNALTILLEKCKSDSGRLIKWDLDVNDFSLTDKLPDVVVNNVTVHSTESDSTKKQSPIAHIFATNQETEKLVSEQGVNDDSLDDRVSNEDAHEKTFDQPLSDKDEQVTLSKVLKKYANMPQYLLAMGSHIVRSECFRRGKFLNALIEKEFMQNLKEKLSYKDKDWDEHLSGIQYLIRESIVSKRQYVTKRIVAVMRSKLYRLSILFDYYIFNSFLHLYTIRILLRE
jgi:hypothetical protein